MTQFTLTVATSSDGFISRAINEPPQAWASAEEQKLFFRDVEAADWAIMGRNTHLAADKPHRRRIVFSRTRAGWQRPTQLWLDPVGMTPNHLASLVRGRHSLVKGLILGGTGVHDWFLSHDAIHRIHLSVEPVAFGDGLPVFSDQTSNKPLEIFSKKRFRILSESALNASGTMYYELSRDRDS